MKNLVLEDAPPVHAHNRWKIKRKHDGLESEPETKEYNAVFKKRRLMDNFESLPYGYS